MGHRVLLEEHQQQAASSLTAATTNFYYNLAIGTCVVSLASLLCLIVLMPIMCAQMNYEKAVIAEKGIKFRVT
jgi:hypothetical protein